MLNDGFARAMVLSVFPFGILYNPASLANALHDLMQNRTFSEADLFEYQGVYHSFSHHSRFSSADAQSAVEKINTSIRFASDFLRNAQVLIVTFGTADVYHLQSSGQVVANCHKLPANQFREERLTIDRITALWHDLISSLKRFNPPMQMIFTVSPIRHWKDGANANQLNKATLLLAIDELVRSRSGCHYFPSYEILLDDLRDYRFYSEDLIHPNNQAIEYVFEKFGDTYWDASVKENIRLYEKEQKMLHHRPLIR